MEIILNTPGEEKTLKKAVKVKVLKVIPDLVAGECVIVIGLIDADGKIISRERIREQDKVRVDAMINASTSCETMLGAVYSYLQSTFDGNISV